MTYTPSTLDDNRPAEERDIPQQMRRYTCAFSNTTAAVFRLPLDIKVCTLVNGTDKDLAFFLTKYDGTAYTDLHSANTSSLIETVAAGATFPIAQGDEWNSIDFKAASGATGTVTLRPGAGTSNGLNPLATRAITAEA